MSIYIIDHMFPQKKILEDENVSADLSTGRKMDADLRYAEFAYWQARSAGNIPGNKSELIFIRQPSYQHSPGICSAM